MTKTTGVSPDQVVPIDLGLLKPHPKNIRNGMKKEDVEELAKTMLASGQLTPALVRPQKDGTFELLAGHRRKVVAGILKWDSLRCIVLDVDDDAALGIVLAENSGREDGGLMRQAAAIVALQAYGWDDNRIAGYMGLPVRTIARRAALSKLCEKAKKALGDPKHVMSRWPSQWIERFATLSPDAQEQAFESRGGMKNVADEGQLDQVIREFTRSLSMAAWKLDDATLDPKAGSCTGCTKHSLAKPSLFADEQTDELPAGELKKATCLDGTCFSGKMKKAREAAFAKAKAEYPELLLAHGPYSGEREYDSGWWGDRKVLADYELDESKEGARGAIPVFIVDGKGRGKVAFVKVRGSAAASKPAKKPKEERSDKEKLKDSKDGIESRRKAFVIDELLAKIVEMEHFWNTKGEPETLQERLDLIAGLLPDFHSGPSYRTGAQGASFAYWKDDKELWIEEMWASVKESLEQELKRFSPESTKGIYVTALFLHDTVFVKVWGGSAKAVAEAVEAIPDPRWWAKAGGAKPAKKEKKDAATAEPSEKGICNVCKCTEDTPCIDNTEAADGEACAWTDKTQTLCTFCVNRAPVVESPKKAKARKAKDSKSAAAGDTD